MNNELQYHKISNVSTYKVRSRLPRLVGKNAFRNEYTYRDEFVAKETITNQGARGWGLSSGLFYHQDPKTDDKMILEKPVLDAFNPDKGIVDMSLSTFDFALHDLAGSILGIPCYKMSGNKGMGTVPTYDTPIYFDDISPDRRPRETAKILEECRYGYDYGYRVFRFKIDRTPTRMNWMNELKRDIDMTRAARRRFPDREILVDVNDAYTVEKMRRYVDGVADMRLYWIGEPLRENEQGFRAFREHLDAKSPRTLIASGETDPNMGLLIDLYRKGPLGVFQMDIQGDYTLGHASGPTPWRRVMLRPEEIGVRIPSHAQGLKLKTHYVAQFCAGCPGAAHAEGVTDTTEGVGFGGYKLKDDKMYLPEKPGFGVDLIWGMPLTGDDYENKTICRQA